MTLYQFSELKEPEQIAILAVMGKVIAERTLEGYFITLFQVEAFYAEIWQVEKIRDFYKIRSFSNTDQLEPYLEYIDIWDLINS